MLKRLAVVTGAVVAAASVASSALAKPVEQVEFPVKYLSKDPKKSRGGLSVRTKFTITDDTGGPPEPLTRLVLRFPKGAAINGKSFKTCEVKKLADEGIDACPKASRLGSGTANATAPPIVANVNAKVTLFNGHGSILVYAIPDLGPSLALEATLRKANATPYGYILDNRIPPITTLPGAPNASITRFDATVAPKPVQRAERRIHYAEGPLVCNGTFFLLDGVFSYESGLVNTVYERFTLRGGPHCS